MGCVLSEVGIGRSKVGGGGHLYKSSLSEWTWAPVDLVGPSLTPIPIHTCHKEFSHIPFLQHGTALPYPKVSKSTRRPVVRYLYTVRMHCYD